MRKENEFDRFFSIGAVSYQRLHKTLKDWGTFMGSEDQLAQHPYYKVGRPSGCMINCQIGVVYYSTHTPPAEIERLTSYDSSCFTRFHPCAAIDDLLPAAKEWHLYDEGEPNQISLPEGPCNIPVWAMARDARYVLAVDALSTKIAKDQRLHAEVARVRVVSSLKEPAPWLRGAIVDVQPLYWLGDASASADDEHLVAGRRYIVFAVGNDDRNQFVTEGSPIKFERCGVQEDNPETRRELAKGFAQNDTLPLMPIP